jgi:hypothetical protein
MLRVAGSQASLGDGLSREDVHSGENARECAPGLHNCLAAACLGGLFYPALPRAR